MKKFFIKLSYLLLLPFLYLIFYYSFPISNDKILDYSLESKILSLVIDEKKINVIIAGDSRAERQLIPCLLNEQTGFYTINIATSSCDLLTTVTAIKQKYILNAKKIFVISASSWQINDGAIDPEYLSLGCYNEMTLFDKFWLYKGNLSEFIRLQNQLFKIRFQHLNVTPDTSYIKELGFLGINGVLNTKLETNSLLKSHPWYKNINSNSVRWSLFQKSLAEIGNNNSLFIIYQPPISQFWKISTSKLFIDVAEQEYSKKVKSEVKKYKNIVFLDFYNSDIPILNDSMYYDVQHLNRKGAGVFSTFLSKKILEVYYANLAINDSIIKNEK